METVCEINQCTGCMACINMCPRSAISIRDSIQAYNAEIDKQKCINCELCIKVCPTISHRHLSSPVYWKQGWAESYIRQQSSSGGAASAIIKTFIESGGYVASCLFEGGNFSFSLTNDLDIAKRFAGSKYVKSNPGKVYSSIKELLNQGEKVLFVGLPCQSAAVQNICEKDSHNNLYTADLICHGTPSPKLIKKYIEEQCIEWDSIQDIQFRDSEGFGVAKNGKRIVPERVMDSYSLAFLNSVDYTENCYSCYYATLNRVSDITLGDAWGQLSNTINGGVSLVLCQSQKGIELVQSAGLHLEDVNLDIAVRENNQLKQPSKRHPGRNVFLSIINKGGSFRLATSAALPKQCIKQSIKTGLIYSHLLKSSTNDDLGGGIV